MNNLYWHNLHREKFEILCQLAKDPEIIIKSAEQKNAMGTKNRLGLFLLKGNWTKSWRICLSQAANLDD